MTTNQRDIRHILENGKLIYLNLYYQMVELNNSWYRVDKILKNAAPIKMDYYYDENGLKISK